MSNAMSLKAKIRNIAKQKISRRRSFCRTICSSACLSALRPPHSAYKDKFVLKGGMLVAAIVGLDNRVILNAHFDTLITPLSIDVSTGDAITPHAVQYRFLIRLCLPKHCAPPPITAASPIRLQMCLPFFTISRAVGNSKPCGNTSFLVWFGR